MKQRYYQQHCSELMKELRQEIGKENFKLLHTKVWWQHFAILLRQLILLALGVYLATTLPNPWWLVGSTIIGFVAFAWTVLLHEVIHKAIFQKARPHLYRLLGYFYAIMGGMSPEQFTKWHLDHHQELGSKEDDPKRCHLTPKIVTRWYKLLYMTPMLFPIYFRAAARETKRYPEKLRSKIKKERALTIGCHLAIMFSLVAAEGWLLAAKVHLIPYFCIFPIAFTINRVGQHYSIDPDDVAHWTSLVRGCWFWDFVYIYSNYHLEHHYFPGVPCYRLPQLQKLLWNFYQRHQIPPQTYGSLLYGWFIKNETPHTKWENQ